MEKEPCRQKEKSVGRLIKWSALSESPRVGTTPHPHTLCPAHIIKSRLKAKGCIIFPIGVRVCACKYKCLFATIRIFTRVNRRQATMLKMKLSILFLPHWCARRGVIELWCAAHSSLMPATISHKLPGIHRIH